MSPREDAFSGEDKPFLDDHEPVQLRQRQKIANWHTYLPWALTALSWLITGFLLVSKSPTIPKLYRPHDASSNPNLCPPPPPAPSCAQHFPTDLEAMHSIVSYQPRHFTGELIYDASTHRIIRNLSSNANDNTTLYFGPPSPTIDAAWHTLLHGEFPRLLLNETTPFLPDLTPLPVDNEYHFEPDVFHSLHCLNAVRMALDKEYYNEDEEAKTKVWPQPDFDRIHLDHCLDQIRQSVMCHGDLSPVPLYSWEGVPLAVGRGGWHTCRDWDSIRDWVDRRNELYEPVGEW